MTASVRQAVSKVIPLSEHLTSTPDVAPLVSDLNQFETERQQWLAERITFAAQLRGREQELQQVKVQLLRAQKREQEYHADFAQCKRVLATLQKKANSQQLDMESIFGSAISLLNTEVKKLKIALQDSEGFRSDAEKRLHAQREVLLARQKELYQLREMLRDSENKREYLERLVSQPMQRMTDHLQGLGQGLAKRIAALLGRFGFSR